MTNPHALLSLAFELRRPRAKSGEAVYALHLTDCLLWMDAQPECSIQAIVTDPPYGLREYTTEEKRKLRNKKGGVCGCLRPSMVASQSSAPFHGSDRIGPTAATNVLHVLAGKALRILVPGGHLFIASSPLLSHLVYMP